MVLKLTIFISSPGDAINGRRTAERVIRRLQGEFGAHVELEPFLREHETARATWTSQAEFTVVALGSDVDSVSVDDRMDNWKLGV